MSTTDESEASGPGSGEDMITCPEGQRPNPETGECEPIPEAEIDAGEPEPIAPPIAASRPPENLMDAIIRTVRAMNEQLYKKLRKEQQEDIARIQKQLTGEAERTLRKSMGLEVDPVVHMSDLQSLMRKVALEKATKSTRTPASPPETDQTKSEQSKAIEAIFKEFGGTA